MIRQAQQEVNRNSYVRRWVPKIDISNKNLEGSLKLEGFDNLQELDCSNNKITCLEVVNCPCLKKIICNGNELIELRFGKSEKLVELNCSNNQLTELDISSCPNLNSENFIYSDNPPSLIINFGRNKKLKKLLDDSKRVKNILLIGKSGSGKSSLANVLLRKSGHFEEVFKESDGGSTSETKKISSVVFRENGVQYRVIDTPGFGNTELSDVEVLNRIIEVYGNFNNKRIQSECKKF